MHGVTSIDTAQLYGDSEEVLGALNLSGFDVGTKIPELNLSIDNPAKALIFKSLNTLKIDFLEYVLLHRPNQLLGDRGGEVFTQIHNYIENGWCKKVGVSVYTPHELSEILDRFKIDIVQLPFNILDGRWVDVIAKAKRLKVEIHARSIFLQGLLFLKNKNPYFNKWAALWASLDKLVEETNMKLWQHSLNYCLHHPDIDKVLVGVDSLSQFSEIISSSLEHYVPLKFEPIEDEQLLNPSNWRLKC